MDGDDWASRLALWGGYWSARIYFGVIDWLGEMQNWEREHGKGCLCGACKGRR